MPKAAILVLADTETREDLARAVNALVAAKEFKDAGDDIRVIFDGAGTKWPGELSQPHHHAHRLYEAVEDTIVGACAFCARAFDAKESVQQAGVRLLDEYEQHPSIRSLVADGYQPITF